MIQAVLMLIYFASGTKMSHRSISGSAAAEGRPCRQSWSLYWHRSSAHLRPLVQTREVWKVASSLALFHQQDHAFPCIDWQSSACTICIWCSAGESALAITVYFSFASHACCWGKKTCFHTRKYTVFRYISHKILPDKSFAMPSLIRNIPIHFFISINNKHPVQCTSPSLPLAFSGQSAQTAPWMFGFCKLQFKNLPLTTHQAIYNNWQRNKFDIRN